MEQRPSRARIPPHHAHIGTYWSVHRAQIAAVVTTSVFTQPAAAYAEMHGIRCVGAPQLAAWATRTGPPPWA
ncbi:hypothetical protein AN219_16895 [Streptomyces nanshensis]|nr:hypothetical protein AN219_16895 [Streptomyces nanshensis]